MKLSKKSVYALRTLRVLAGAYESPERSPLSVSALAEECAVPLKYLEQVLLTLRKAGFLVSVRGKYGGYLLRKPPEEITLGNVIRAIDGPLAPIACASRTQPHECTDCPYTFESCWLRKLMLRVRDNISAILDHETLAMMVSESRHSILRSPPE